MTARSRPYDIVLLGATGYTGRFCAEHITTSLPTDLKWAVAGRSRSRLSAVLEDIKHRNPDRLQPAIEEASLSLKDLTALAQQTQILLNTVGPYFRYSTPVVEACAKSGTHYLDVTGETPWVYELIEKYHDTAKANGAIIIPEIGFESSPSDLLAWSIASLIRDEYSVGTKEVVASLHNMRGQPSGGTLATIVGLLDHYSLVHLAKSSKPFAMSPIPHPRSPPSVSLMTRIFGIRTVPNLGILTTHIGAGPNVATVQRTWGLLGGNKFYGPNFEYSEYMRVRNKTLGVLFHFVVSLGFVALALPPLRWLLKIAAHNFYAPGQGAPEDAAKKDYVEIRAIADADQAVSHPKRAMAKFKWNGGIYQLTGIFLAEAAMVILKDDGIVDRLGGGLLTPAMLGQPFVDRLRNAGVVIESRILPDQ